MLGYGWVVVIDDCNIAIRQVGDTLFDEVAQNKSSWPVLWSCESRGMHPHGARMQCLSEPVQALMFSLLRCGIHVHHQATRYRVN